MEIRISGTPDEIEKLLNAIGGSKEQFDTETLYKHLFRDANAPTSEKERKTLWDKALQNVSPRRSKTNHF